MANQDGPLLSLSDAADRLAVTPELIVSFSQRPVLSQGAHWQLAGVERGGRLWFRSLELDRFTAQLHEPWCAADAARPAIPAAISRFLSVECLGSCPHCKAAGPREIAHITPFRHSRSHHPHCLIRLCASCHRAFDDGLIPVKTIQALKAQLQARLRSALRQSQADETFAPPAPASGFRGRALERSTLGAKLRETPSLLVTGIGGSGKTQLLLQALRDSDFGRTVFWIPVEPYSTTAELRATLQALSARLGGQPHEPLTARLDQRRACLVFDGVEHLSGDFDGLNDLLDEVLGSSVATQVVATSQVDLAALPFEVRLRLEGLPDPTAREILTIGAKFAEDEAALTELVSFAEGHALTLRIAAALMRHLGGARSTLARIAARGAPAVAMPGRKTQTRITSLELCLELAVSQLGDDEQRLLWVAAEAPAGLFPDVVEPSAVGIDDIDAARAGLQSWDLLQLEGPEDYQILRVLSPVRLFLRSWFDAHPLPTAEMMQHGFCHCMAARAEFIDHHFVHGGRAPLGMTLMERELPNFAVAFNRAIESPESKTREFAGHFAARLMTFLFTSGRFQFGFDLMMRAAETERRDGELQDALQTLLQAQSLALRARDASASAAAVRTAREWAAGSTNVQATVWSMEATYAYSLGRHTEAASLAAKAHEVLGQQDPDGHLAQGVLGVLARALEFSGRPAEALPLYEQLLTGAEQRQDPINRGAILHHTGNCLAHGDRDLEAFGAYLSAARQFAEIGAVEFLSNAFGEAGLVLPNLPANFDIAGQLDSDLVQSAVDDALNELLPHMSSSEDFDLASAMVRLKKAGGALWLASFSGVREELADVAEALAEQIRPHLPPPGRPRSDHDVFLFQLTWLINLMHVLGQPYMGTPAPAEEVYALADASASAFLGPLQATMEDVLITYLGRQRGTIMTREELERLLVSG